MANQTPIPSETPETPAAVPVQTPAAIPVESAIQRYGEKLLWLLPILLFVILSGIEYFWPAAFLTTPMLDLNLPSEKAIPQEIPSNNPEFPLPTAASSPADLARWQFRYAPTGTEFGAGIPYWIYKVLPKIFDSEFHGQGWEHFGFMPDNQDYYKERQGLPSGLVLSDTVVDIPLFPVGVKLKRVSLNCSACHRGGIEEGTGLTLIDGMPNHTGDLQAFKRFVTSAFKDDRFNAPRLITEINLELAALKAPPLNDKEQIFYTAIVAFMKNSSDPAINWMDNRPNNGPGRIDPFNSVKFEKLGVPDDGTNGTENFPAIWNQKLHSWHHYDSNTNSLEARNFGSALGVGAISLSIHRDDIRAVGDWIEDLPAPKYPFDIKTELVARGADIYKRSCANCHGIYDPNQRTITLFDPIKNQSQIFQKNAEPLAGSHYMNRDIGVGTDDSRLKAFDTASAAALNEYGERHDLWPAGAFRAAGANYLCRPLDGIWARSPYLHNGSVPTLDDLLKPDTQRPATFRRGSTKFDPAKVGFDSTSTTDRGIDLFLYDTSQNGNSNRGHNFPATPLNDNDRAALIEYLKTL